MAGPERLLTPEAVAERLGISKITARAWMRAGKLPLTRLGEKGLLRCRESDLNAFIAAGSEPAFAARAAKRKGGWR